MSTRPGGLGRATPAATAPPYGGHAGMVTGINSARFFPPQQQHQQQQQPPPPQPQPPPAQSQQQQPPQQQGTAAAGGGGLPNYGPSSRQDPEPGQDRRVQNVEDLDHDELNMDWYSSIDDIEKEAIDQSYSLFMDLHPEGLNFYDLRLALKTLGFDLPNNDIRSWIEKFGQAPSDWKPPSSNNPADPQQQQQYRHCPIVQLRLSLDNYRHVAGCLIAFRPQRELWARAFGVFDVDKKGMITASDLQRASSLLGRELTEGEIQRMVEEADIEDRGGVDLEEFIVIMERSSRKAASTYA